MQYLSLNKHREPRPTRVSERSEPTNQEDITMTETRKQEPTRTDKWQRMRSLIDQLGTAALYPDIELNGCNGYHGSGKLYWCRIDNGYSIPTCCGIRSPYHWEILVSQ